MPDYKLPIITGTSLTVGDLLRWDGNNWVNYPNSNFDHYVDRGDPADWDFKLKKESGTATATSANHLVDLTAAFETKGIIAGNFVHNTTDDTWAEITVVNSETDLTLDADIMVNTEAYYVGDFKTDGNIYQLDTSLIVPSGAIAVIFRGGIDSSNAGNHFAIRTNGNSNWINRSTTRVTVATIDMDINAMLKCASNRIFDYRTANAIYGDIYLCVGGWWI